MTALYTIILRDCPQASHSGVALFLGKAFSLKESTCAAIASSAPIILVSGLARDEAAAMSLTLSGIQRLGGVLEFTTVDQGDLPKIDWPKRPLVFKREVSEHLEDLQTLVPGPDGRRRPLIDFLVAGLSGQTVTVTNDEEPEIAIKPAGQRGATAPAPTANAAKFDALPLPEITPFSTQVIAKTPTPLPGSSKIEAGARMGELFPDEEQPGFVPNNEDITNLLNRLLPEDEAAERAKENPQSSRRPAAVATASAAPAGTGYSVFLAKIADEARRTKAAELIVELAHIGKDEAENLSKKVIIPVLKGVSKDDAEAAKAKFAKIGILARVKGPE